MGIPMRCVDCRGDMVQVDGVYTCVSCARRYGEDDGVILAWPKAMNALAKEEAVYHDHVDEDARDVHQLSAWRNIFYHSVVWESLHTIPKQSSVLEIGAGSGFDAKELVDSYRLTLSDISPQTLARLRSKLPDGKAVYVAADGAVLPFQDESFHGLYMLATWHHFEYPAKTLEEFFRVLKPHGLLGIAVEPNRVYFRWIKYFRTYLCKAVHAHEHEGSHADAQMEGFSYTQLKTLFGSDRWQEVVIRPMWLLSGFVHYGLEFFYRMLKLQHRVHLPLFIEKGMVRFDEWLFKIPLINRMGWHWIIIAKKKG